LFYRFPELSPLLPDSWASDSAFRYAYDAYFC
jgi:hypothetical protein